MKLAEILDVIRRQRATGEVAVRFTGVFEGQRLPLGDLHAKLAGDRWVGFLLFPFGEPQSRVFFDRNAEAEFAAVVDRLFASLKASAEGDEPPIEPDAEELKNATWITQRVTAPMTFVRGGNA